MNVDNVALMFGYNKLPDLPRYIIFGRRKGQLGCGVIQDLKSVTKQEALDKLTAWRIAMPDWNFILDDIQGMSGEEVGKLFDRDLNKSTRS